MLGIRIRQPLLANLNDPMDLRLALASLGKEQDVESTASASAFTKTVEA